MNKGTGGFTVTSVWHAFYLVPSSQWWYSVYEMCMKCVLDPLPPLQLTIAIYFAFYLVRLPLPLPSLCFLIALYSLSLSSPVLSEPVYN